LLEFKVDAGCYKQNRSSFKKNLQRLLQGQIEFVLHLDPHEPQLLFPALLAKIVVQALKKTTDELDDAMAEEDSHASQLIGKDADSILTLHDAALIIRADINDVQSMTTTLR
jgi:hypothetical protein